MLNRHAIDCVPYARFSTTYVCTVNTSDRANNGLYHIGNFCGGEPQVSLILKRV